VNGYALTKQSAVRGLLADAEHVYAGTEWAARFAAALNDLDGPLRVAVGGPVSAGKSTLLNALIGARVAPTDAGECTRILTWYGYGEVERAWGVPAADPTGRVELELAWQDGRLRVARRSSGCGCRSNCRRPRWPAWCWWTPREWPPRRWPWARTRGRS
jgi:hypothetical protein